LSCKRTETSNRRKRITLNYQNTQGRTRRVKSGLERQKEVYGQEEGPLYQDFTRKQIGPRTKEFVAVRVGNIFRW
jgi:hypothetical protein